MTTEIAIHPDRLPTRAEDDLGRLLARVCGQLEAIETLVASAGDNIVLCVARDQIRETIQTIYEARPHLR